MPALRTGSSIQATARSVAWPPGGDVPKTIIASANDLTHPQLLAVSAATNRGTGDQGPEEWQPPLESYWCVYGRAWTSVKSP